MWRAGPPTAAICAPRPAIIPVLPLARRCLIGFEALRFPHLKLLAEPDESNVAGNTGVVAQAFRQSCASILIDRENLARAEQGGRELVLLVRVRREVLDQCVDLVDEPLASGIERWRIERRIAIDAVETVFGENCAERSRD